MYICGKQELHFKGSASTPILTGQWRRQQATRTHIWFIFQYIAYPDTRLLALYIDPGNSLHTRVNMLYYNVLQIYGRYKKLIIIYE